MISERIKSLLGEDLAKQVEEAVKGKGKEGKDLDLVVGNDGTFVPIDKHDGEKQRAISAENALKAAAEAIKALGGTGDPAKLGEDVTKAQGTIDTLKADHKTEIQKIQKNTALRMALADKTHDPDDIISNLDMSKIEIGDDGGLKTDLEAFLAPLRERKPYLFKEKTDPEVPTLSGARPALPNGEPGAQKTTDKMTYEELCAHLEAHPDAKLE